MKTLLTIILLIALTGCKKDDPVQPIQPCKEACIIGKDITTFVGVSDINANESYYANLSGSDVEAINAFLAEENLPFEYYSTDIGYCLKRTTTGKFVAMWSDTDIIYVSGCKD